MKKKIVSALFVLCIILSLTTFPVSADAGHAPPQYVFGDWTYERSDDNAATIIKYNGAEKSIEIPREINGYPVTKIACGIFDNSGFRSLEKIIIPNSVTEIGYCAFDDCTSLVSVTIPESVTTIGYCAFCGCTSLATITLPHSVTTIDCGAFARCPSLTSVTIPDSVTSIGELAFGYLGNEYISEEEKIPDFTIYGYVDSAAETYARENDYKFIAITDLTDEKTGISVSGELSSHVQLQVINTESTNTRVNYDITLVKDGIAVQPKGKVTVKIPVPANINGVACKVYRQEIDNTYTDMNAVYKNGHMVFATDHFSKYLLTTDALTKSPDDTDKSDSTNKPNGTDKIDVTSPSIPKTGATDIGTALTAFAMLTMAGGTASVTHKKRKK